MDWSFLLEILPSLVKGIDFKHFLENFNIISGIVGFLANFFGF